MNSDLAILSIEAIKHSRWITYQLSRSSAKLKKNCCKLRKLKVDFSMKENLFDFKCYVLKTPNSSKKTIN